MLLRLRSKPSAAEKARSNRATSFGCFRTTPYKSVSRRWARIGYSMDRVGWEVGWSVAVILLAQIKYYRKIDGDDFGRTRMLTRKLNHCCLLASVYSSISPQAYSKRRYPRAKFRYALQLSLDYTHVGKSCGRYVCPERKVQLEDKERPSIRQAYGLTLTPPIFTRVRRA